MLILQHPPEVHHAKNSARLLHLSLPGSRIVVGETFDTATLHAAMPEQKYTVLLYPPTAHAGHDAAAPLDCKLLKDPSKIRLVLNKWAFLGTLNADIQSQPPPSRVPKTGVFPCGKYMT